MGRTLTPLWNSSGAMAVGTPIGSSTLIRVLEEISFFTGLGVVIVFIAAMSIGRLSVIGVRDARLAEREVVMPDSECRSRPPMSGPSRCCPGARLASAVTSDGGTADQ